MRARELDLPLVLGTAAIIAIGVTMVYSAASSGLWRQQAVVAVVALAVALAAVYVPDRIFHELAYPLYGAGLVSLLLVLVWGSGEPAARWLSLGWLRVQPSEFAKLGVILALARFLADRSPEQVARPRAIGLALLLMALPMLLVRHQPDLGTAVSFGAAFVPMLYWAGMRPLYIFFLVAPALSVFFSFEPLWQERAPVIFALFIIASSVVIQAQLARLWVTFAMLVLNLSAGLATALWTNLLHDYQKARILTFLDPESDPLGAGWNIIQSKIAIGSGGPTGRGFLQGTQTNYEFLPAAHTDFIFSVIGEEFGFLGTGVTLVLFFVIIWRCLHIATLANSRFSGLLAVGLASMLTFHVFINVGMTIGVMPVTGLPLPFLSYGGSSLLTNCLAVGLLLHVYACRHEY